MTAQLLVFGVAAMWLVAVLLTAPGLRRILKEAFAHPFREPAPGENGSSRRLKVAVLTISLVTIAAILGASFFAGVHPQTDPVKQATRGSLAIALLGVGGLLGLLGGRRYFQAPLGEDTSEAAPRK